MAAKDVGSDALKGAAVGSVVPGVGTAVGAIGGGIYGLFDGDDPVIGGGSKPAGPAVPNYDLGIQGTEWGGYAGAGNDYSNRGLGYQSNANDVMNDAVGAAWEPRGPQAWENQQLSDNEENSRDWDQSGAIELAREAAMGLTPSAAAYQMQSGLDQSLAAQQAQMGGARGSAGIALASGNAASNSANLMNQTYNQAAQLRAQEMANATGLYGGLAGQQRSQDQNRLSMGNQMSQYNAGLNDQYKLGMLNAGSQYGNLGLGYYNGAQNPLTNTASSQNLAYDRFYNQHESNANRAAGIAGTNAQIGQQNQDRTLRWVGTAGETFGRVAGAAG